MGLDIGGTSNTESVFALGGSLDASYLQRKDSLSLHADGKYGTTTRETGTIPSRRPPSITIASWPSTRGGCPGSWRSGARPIYEHDAIARLEAREILAVGFGGHDPGKAESRDRGKRRSGLRVGELYQRLAFDRRAHARRLGQGLEYWFSDRVSLKHTLAYYPAFDGPSDFFLSADLALDTDLGRRFNVELYGRLEHNSRPARNVRETTTSYRVSLKYRL